ncbi:MAG TPA: sigma-70 family RNA polymerase sigma factor, partial [Planctomycetota bacterium]
MSSSSLPPLDAQLLLEHAPWMRRLARSLTASPERAEDLSQETWRRLLESPPRLDQPFRGWIATVMRNLVRAEGRGHARRTARELASARPEAEPSSHELVERAALQRELVQAVLELEEPYRT